MPASPDYTRIKVMRGSTKAIESWIPEEGEPLLDLNSGTLLFGDGATLGGFPINTHTTKRLNPPIDLDKQILWGRYFVNGRTNGLPNGLISAKYFLEVKSSGLNSPEILQEIQILDGVYSMQTYQRLSLNTGTTWSSWYNFGGTFGNSHPGTFDDDPDLDHYILSSQSYVTKMIHGPVGTDNCSGFIIVYRASASKPYVFQKLIITVCPKNEYTGRIFYRFSTDANVNWTAPGYTWRELLGAEPVSKTTPDLTILY